MEKKNSDLPLNEINLNMAQYFREAKQHIDDGQDEEGQLVQQKFDELIAANRFDDTQFHASGGLKKITVVKDRFTGRKVAHATLKAEKPSSRQILDFLKEASLTARLQHQNIVPVYKVGMDEDKPYFSMKLIEGSSLQDLLENGSLESNENFNRVKLLDIFVKVCDSISSAHAQGILHMDLKPDNIVLGDYGEVIVCDWGLALEKDEENEWINHTSETLQGTPGYIAPERLTGQLKLDERVDVYSLGILLYNILTGKSPFQGESADQVLKNSLKGNFILPSLIVKDLPSSLEAIILKAMADDPKDRYANVTELLNDVRACLGGFSPKAEHASFFKQFCLLMKRNRRIAITIASAITLISSLTLIFIVQLADREQRALAARDKAETEKQLRLNLRKKAAVHFYKNAYRAEKLHHFNEAFYYCELVVDFVPENKAAHYLLGKLYLGQGKYTEALRAFDRASGEDLKGYMELASKLNEPTSSQELLSLLKYCSTRPGGRRVVASFCVNQPQLIRAVGVYKLIESVESSVLPENWLYDELNKKLKINAESFNFLSPVSALPLVSLDISGTGVSYLHPISHMNLEELNVSRTKVADLNPLISMKITKLDISYTNIIDLQVLKNLPLKELNIVGLRTNFDIHLLDLMSLQRLTLDTNGVSPYIQKQLLERGVDLVFK
ncbi:protein kinase [Lentisphaera profundi]|uniref:Protein kinase n=1 Tax=Lentisphaera profundi TaxID=1658616 RepID=A0ABY7VXE3_9BACT|nr:serine/threonine-protein kinase [Lentisphaera profundi]WDE98464.1 protein kinase [Lentisphaera profundi]